MELKPARGVRVLVAAKREAIFGEESVTVRNVSIPGAGALGVLTGVTLAGFCEVEMPALDGKRHWYPVGDLVGEKGEKIVEEEIPIELDEDAGPEEV
jgi:hypothetical protein